MHEILTSYLVTGKVPPCVKIVSHSETELSALPKVIKRRIKLELCYGNALRIATDYPNVEYVEGEILVNGIIPIVHAWNCVNGKHIDLTFELNGREINEPHYPIVQGTIGDLKKQGYKFNGVIDILTQWLNRPEQRERYKDSPLAKLNEMQRL